MNRRWMIILFLLAVTGLGLLPGMANAQQGQQQKGCPGAPPIRLAVGGFGRVTMTPPGQTSVPVRLRATAGKTGKMVGQLTDGMTFAVADGPVCKDSYAWWQVNADIGQGWLAEGDADSYYVEPISDPSAAQATPVPNDAPTPTLGPTVTSEPSARFAMYEPRAPQVVPKLQAYQIAPDFTNVVLTSALTADQLDYIQRNGFVVSPGSELEFYTVYEKARYNYEPLFITTDSLLHSFHLIFDKVLRTAERTYFLPLLRDLDQGMLAQADKNYQALKGTDWEESARRTVAYIGVSAKLIDPQARIPAYVNDLVTPEIANINNAGGIGPSAVFPELTNGEDWSQYIPRGHYTLSDDLKAYFRAMMYYGRMTFRLNRPEETKSALLLAMAIRDANIKGKHGLDAWSDLYGPTVFFVGRSDALTIPQYLQVMDQVYGTSPNAKAIQGKDVMAFITAAQAQPAPKILNAVIQDTDNIDQETKGLRFMGQRFVWDAYVFRNLIYRNVGTRENPRALPLALDVFAAMGSDRALQILDKEGATAFDNYSSQMTKMRDETKSLAESDWTETLYNTWLYSLQALAQPVAEGYPSFMTNQAYQDRSLYAALGSFAELKHDTILYAEQAYAEMGGGGGKGPAPEPVVPPNYVEPLPLFWARLAALAEMTSNGLGKRNLLDPADADTLKQIAELARHFQDYSVKELKGEQLTADEQNELRFYGGALEKLLSATADNYALGQPAGFPQQQGAQPQAALIADIATDPQSQKVKEIAVGRVFDIFAAVPVGDKLYLAHGAVFSYYEFDQPLKNRLTDEAWQTMLDKAQAPAVPDWTFSFMSKTTVDSMLSQAVRSFQSYSTNILWDDPVESYKQFAADASKDKVAKWLASQLQPLAKARQYEGRQIIETNFRSFDMKDAKTAIVTTRETWRGELHNYGPDAFSDGPKIADRGPYTIDVTYTLTLGQDNQWTLTNIVVNGSLPSWNKVSNS